MVNAEQGSAKPARRVDRLLGTRRPPLCFLCLLAWVGVYPGLAQTSEKIVSVATRQSGFTIPFSIRQSESKPREIQLFVSQDGGRTWDLYARQRPTAGGFPFQAQSDGEYWFTARSVSSDEQESMTDGLRPELHVLIDTNPPRLELSATVGKSGEVVAAWRAVDENLVPDSLTLEYQELVENRPAGDWQRVAIDKPRHSSALSDLAGRASWWPANATGGLRVRAVVHDRAGNMATVNRRIIRVNTARLARQRQVSDRPADSVGFATTPVEESPRPDRYYDVPAPSVGDGAAEETGAGDDQQADSSSFNPSRSWDLLIPEGEQLRLTNSRRVTLSYDVLSVGPSGTRKVELWATRDGGQTWENWGVDADHQSPMLVEIGEEGVFGFRVRITSGLGLTAPAPRPGDLADLWIGVDLTRPTAEITSLPFGTGRNAGQLIINWSAEDINLGDRPIDLFFSATPQGPWRPIATQLPNSGQYRWQVEAGHAREVYLRLRVTDSAGNVGEQTLEQPVNLEGLSPRGRISGFRAAK